MRKLITIVGIALVGLGAVVWAQTNAVPSTQPDQRSVETRLRAIETYLKLDAKPTDPVVGDAKSFDDLKAALLRLERQQDELSRQMRTLAQAKSQVSGTSTEVQNLERELAGLRAMIRELNDRVRRMETRL